MNEWDKWMRWIVIWINEINEWDELMREMHVMNELYECIR